MTPDEKGYILFRCDWEPADPPAVEWADALRTWRDRLHRLGLVGVYPNGIGYGNLSCRPVPGTAFVVTGTGTGGLAALGPEHLTAVTGYDLAGNTVRCRGPVKASSESLTHAAVYEAGPAIRAVVHVHHPGLWQRLYGVAPTTDPAVEAGTPAMAFAIAALIRGGARPGELIVMGGHRDGLIAFGGTLDEAGSRLVEALGRFAR
jgi:hypothetical protein